MRVARLFAPPLYEALALRYMTPPATQAAPPEAETPKTLEPLFEDKKNEDAAPTEAPRT